MTEAIRQALRAAANAQRATAAALEALADAVGQGPPAAPVSASEALLDVRQAAKRLGMSPSWVYRAIEDGRLPTVRLGNRVRLRAEDLDAFVSERR